MGHHLRGSIAGWVVVLSLTVAAAATPPATSPVTPEPETHSGWLAVLWENPTDGGAEHLHFLLIDDEGRWHPLDVDPRLIEAAGGLERLTLQRVDITATPRLRSRGLDRRPLQVLSITRQPPGKPTREADPSAFLPAGGALPYVTVLCKFSDTGKDPKKVRYFEDLMGSTEPGMDHYWREVSYDNIHLTGSIVLGWYELPETHAYYQTDPNQITDDCLALADPDVYFPDFEGINMVFPDLIGPYSGQGGRAYHTLDGITKVYGTTWLYGFTQQLFAHEMGHSFSLPHSSGPYGATYDSNWDVMSGGGVADPQWGKIANHTIGYHKDGLGWIPPAQKYVSPGNMSETITLERLTQPTDGGTAHLMAQLQIDGTRFYTVEARRFAGYDTALPTEAVVLHEVDPSRINDAHVVDPDGNGDVNDAGAAFTVGETFDDPVHDISVHIDADTGTGYTVTLTQGTIVTPDFLVTALAGPLSVAPGETFSFTGTLENQGNGGTTLNVYTGIYLSADPVITVDDAFLGSQGTFGGLSAGGSAPIDGSVQAPDVPPGTYYLGAYADYPGTFTESDEANNGFTANDPIQIVDSAPSTFTGNATDLTPTAATLRGSVNPHGQATDAWFEWGETTAYGNTTPVQTIGSGVDLVSISEPITGLSPGVTYHYRVVAQNATGTSYGDDRTFTTVSILDIDLITTDVADPLFGRLIVGSTVDLPVTVHNQGTDDSGFFRISIYLSDTPDLSGNFVELDFRGVSAGLPAGQSHVSNFTNVWIPPESPLGNVYLVGAADSYDAVFETDETNNLLADPVEVQAPDITVQEVTGPGNAQAGTNISGTVVVANQGNTDTQTGFDIEIYLSTDAVISTGDISLGTVATSLLFSSRTVNFTKYIPLSVSKGVYYLGAIADSGDEVVESDETNNAGAAADTTRIR